MEKIAVTPRGSSGLERGTIPTKPAVAPQPQPAPTPAQTQPKP
jgi:hypothetical protein